MFSLTDGTYVTPACRNVNTGTGEDPDTIALAIAAVLVILVFVLTKVIWLGAWVWARYQETSFRVVTPPAKRIVQSDDDTIAMVLGGKTVNHRFRRCHDCASASALVNRGSAA
jgi:hypothetical protein